MNIQVGDTVTKKSGKPFLNRLKHEVGVSIGHNELDPKKRTCAFFSNGSNCNLDLLIKIDTHEKKIDNPTTGSMYDEL